MSPWILNLKTSRTNFILRSRGSGWGLGYGWSRAQRAFWAAPVFFPDLIKK